MTTAIQTRDLHYRAGKTFELRDLSLEVPDGSIYGFLGPNGSGKTTTIRLLLGLLRPLGGTIAVLGYSIPRESPRMLARTGYVPERPHLYPSLTVDETLRYHSAFYETWDRRRCEALFTQFGLNREQRVARLSKGETGKLMMLLALAQNPDLLMLDEPTDGLDPVVRRDVLMALVEYVSQKNATVFISSHLVHELERICDWVGALDNGHMVAEMPMQTFKNGIKRLRVQGAPSLLEDTPFVVLAREEAVGLGAGETWIVRGWQAPMKQYFDGIGASLKEVIDLDLEEGFVELLRTARTAGS
ncbi:MAG: ABC transporter ATP-binding protein [Gemmatimonadales bacterium]